jgi:GTP cyclohydrolase IA
MPDKKIKEGIEGIVEGFKEKLGILPDDENYLDTPNRIFRMYNEIIKTPEIIKQELNKIFSKTFPSKYKGHVIWPDIKTFSLCPHHWAIVEYEVTIAYLPRMELRDNTLGTSVVGLSKPVRLARLLACRPILQEDYTQDIADTLDERILPRGIAVITRGLHGCMKCRGVMTDKPVIMSVMQNSYMEDGKMRQELFELLKLYRR